MNKNLLAVFLSMVLFAMTNSSCKDSKDEPDPTPTPDVSRVTANPSAVFPYGLPKEIDDWTFTTNSKGLVTQITNPDSYYGVEIVTFDYTPVKTTVAESNQAVDFDMSMLVKYDDETERVFIKLNDDGFIQYAYVIENEKNNVYYSDWTFQYNENGQLTGGKKGSYDGDYEPQFTIIYNSESDITRIYYSENEDGESSNNDVYTNILYSDESHISPTINKSGIMILDNFGIGMVWAFGSATFQYASFAGLLGKGTKHLPIKAINMGGVDAETEFTWMLNSQNMPVQLTSDAGSNSWSYIFEDIETLTFKW